MKIFTLRYLFPMIAVCMAVLLVAVIGYANNQSSASLSPSTTPTPTSIPGLGEFVIYPQAEEVKLDRTGTPQDLELTYTVVANPKDIVEFYKAAMKDQGWMIRSENNLDEAKQLGLFEGVVNFALADQQRTLPYFLLLNVHISSPESSGIGRSYVRASLWRIPDLNKLPLAPDAQQTETKKEYVKGAYGSDIPVDATYYFTNLSPQQVEDYYKDVMPQRGWGLVTSDSGDPYLSPEGLTYRFNLGGGDYSEATGFAIITAKLGTDGRTKVRLEITGFQLMLKSVEK